MKKLVLLLLFLFMIVGCKQSGEVKNSMSGANFSAEEKEDFMGIVALAKALSDGKYTVTSKISDIELEVVFDYLAADDSYDYPIQKGDKRELVITKENNFYMLREYLNNKLMVTEKHSSWEEVFFYEENGSNLGDGSGENTFTSEEKEYIEKTHYAKKEINDNKIILQTNFGDGTEFTQTLTKVNGVIERVPSDELNRNWQTEYTTDIRMSFGYVEGNVLTVEERDKVLEFLKSKDSLVYSNDNTWTVDGVTHTYSYVYSVKNPINNDRRKIVFEKVDDYYILIIGGLYYIKEPSLELLIERNIDIF